MFSNYFWASITSSKLLFQWWFFFNWWFRKRSIGIKIGEWILWKLWTRWLKIGLGVGESPWTLWRVKVILKIIVTWLGIWVILSRLWQLAYMIGSCGLELSESNEVRVKYGFIFELKKLLLLKSISQFTKKKTNKQTNKQAK